MNDVNVYLLFLVFFLLFCVLINSIIVIVKVSALHANASSNANDSFSATIDFDIRSSYGYLSAAGKCKYLATYQVISINDFGLSLI